MQCTNLGKRMSFDFNSNINPIKAQAAYKDGGGMGGGGMYMRQRKKQKDEEDIFERSDEKDDNEILFETELKEEDIPNEIAFNKFVNWFRKKKK